MLKSIAGGKSSSNFGVLATPPGNSRARSDLPGAIHSRPLLWGLTVAAAFSPLKNGTANTLGDQGHLLIVEGIGPTSSLGDELRKLRIAFVGQSEWDSGSGGGGSGSGFGLRSFLAIPWESVAHAEDLERRDHFLDAVTVFLCSLVGVQLGRDVRRVGRLEFPPEGCPDLEAFEGDALDLVRTFRSFDAEFHRTGKEIARVESNVFRVLESSPVFAGAIRLDELSGRPSIQRALPWDPTFELPRPWSKNDTSRFTYFLDELGLRVTNERMIEAAVMASAAECTVHFVRDRLSQLCWDGVPRLEGWLTRYLGVKRSDYSLRVGTWFLVGAVARAMDPGCKHDCVLIIEGPQGLKKSTAIERLVDQAIPNAERLGIFSRTSLNIDVRDKDRFQQLSGVWVQELGEFASIRRSDWSTVKDYLAQTGDKYRRTHASGADVTMHLRQNVFFATINPSEEKGGYLSDPTGSRRFWPVWTESIDFRAIEQDGEQLWAEAVRLYKRGCVERHRHRRASNGGLGSGSVSAAGRTAGPSLGGSSLGGPSAAGARSRASEVDWRFRWWSEPSEFALFAREWQPRAKTGDPWADTLRERLLGPAGYLERDVLEALRQGRDPSRPYEALRSLGWVLDLLGKREDQKGPGDVSRASACLRELGFVPPGNSVRVIQTKDKRCVPHWFFGGKSAEVARRLLLAEAIECTGLVEGGLDCGVEVGTLRALKAIALDPELGSGSGVVAGGAGGGESGAGSDSTSDSAAALWTDIRPDVRRVALELRGLASQAGVGGRVRVLLNRLSAVLGVPVAAMVPISEQGPSEIEADSMPSDELGLGLEDWSEP